MRPYAFLFQFVELFSLVLILAILSRKENRRANVFLCGVIGFAALAQWVRFLLLTGEIGNYPYLLRVPFATSLLVPALFYLYTMALTTPDFRWKPSYLLHLLPFAFGVLWNLIFLRNETSADWEAYLQNILSAIVLTAYLVASLIQIQRYRKMLPHYFSGFQKVKLTWLKILLILFVFPWILAWVDVASGPVFQVERWMLPTVNVILILIGFFGWRQSVIFSADPGQAGALQAVPIVPDKSPRQALCTAEELAQRKKILENYISENKPYLESDLRLVDLADSLGLKAYQVSEILNRGLGLTFYDYINGLRIEEVKRRLVNPAFANLNILGIAMESGFNSKSVFNKTFLKLTGMSPSAFRAAKSNE